MSSVSTFKRQVSQSKYTLVIFCASWCKPCKRIRPEIDRLEEKNADTVRFIHLDVDENLSQDLSNMLQIDVVPTFHFYRDGHLVHSVNKADIQKVKEGLRSLTSSR